MRQITFTLLLVVVSLSSYTVHAQDNQDSINIAQLVNSCLTLKLENTSVNVNINSKVISKENKSLYLAYQNGMFEHYNYNKTGSSQSRAYKAHYPAPGFSLMHFGGRVRDSFNPHGSDDIGSALLNGFINGILLGNKY